MTISSTSGANLTIDTLVLRAYQMAGLMAAEQGRTGPTWTQKASLARDLLQTVLNELQTDGVMAHFVNAYTLTLVSGTYIYSMPAATVKVIEDGAYIAASETDISKASGETPVLQKDRETWQRLSAKSATSRPTLFYVEESLEPIRVFLWPIPDEAGTIRFQLERTLADTTDGAATVDLPLYWTQFLIWELAHQLASAHSLDNATCGRLANTAAAKKERARAKGNQHVPNRFYVDHRSAWSNR